MFVPAPAQGDSAAAGASAAAAARSAVTDSSKTDVQASRPASSGTMTAPVCVAPSGKAATCTLSDFQADRVFIARCYVSENGKQTPIPCATSSYNWFPADQNPYSHSHLLGWVPVGGVGIAMALLIAFVIRGVRGR